MICVQLELFVVPSFFNEIKVLRQMSLFVQRIFGFESERYVRSLIFLRNYANRVIYNKLSRQYRSTVLHYLEYFGYFTVHFSCVINNFVSACLYEVLTYKVQQQFVAGC
eukprot:TRINITY_DN6706_c0_g1_i1.p35 TRINITY_DN6706_c0_g1~~TRINITY_DN6706_c0_g1_i1.p35  ORF type:complete len:109 (-),score=4.84 TRINITY_DN6706_c0_g1_i1:5289-5615(-)